MKYTWLLSLASSKLAACGTILWDGRFNDLSSSSDLKNWSWANQVGPYQYYIHGSSDVTDYVNLSSDYKNPADTGSEQGVKITLDSTAYWNGQTMRRTELIPQTTAAINSGKVWYHFSMKRTTTNAPSIYREHQINFFESHFTEMKAGWISGETATSDSNLQWMVGGTSKWAVAFDADVWHNVAYEIDFSANTVAFWHSTGADPLELTVSAVSASTSSNGADWHLGVLELPRDGYTDADEDLYFSGVYVESGSITTDVIKRRRFLKQHDCRNKRNKRDKQHYALDLDDESIYDNSGHDDIRFRNSHGWLLCSSICTMRRYWLDRLHQLRLWNDVHDLE
ncbi:hypothetical protein GGR57DRAFT_508463 [Xylariaceae sp. FL1272]|nr:hypothetical protein GGR57DRAFT_508463 [Xylariaceae sp. FL1272]